MAKVHIESKDKRFGLCGAGNKRFGHDGVFVETKEWFTTVTMVKYQKECCSKCVAIVQKENNSET